MSIQAIIEKLSPAAKLMLLIGLFIFFLGIASLAQVFIILPYADLKSWKELATLEDFSNPNILKGLKIAQAVSAILAFIVPALLFAYLAHPNPPEGKELEREISSPSGRSGGAFGYLKLNKGFPLVFGAAVVILVFAAMPLINWTGELNSHLSLPKFMSELENWMKSSEESAKKITEAFLKMDGITDLAVNLIVVALLAAIGEELLFRGAMQNVLLEWAKNKHAAVWITAILFSALHAQFYGFLPRMLLGVVLGYLYVWSGSLWLSMLFHFLNNGLAVLFSYLIAKGRISETAETVGAGDTPVYFVVVSAVASIGLLYFIYQQKIQAENQ